MIILLKSLYQISKTLIPEFFASQFVRYREKNTKFGNKLRINLDKQKAQTQLLLFCPVNNWEINMINAFKELFVTTHFEKPPGQFFSNKHEWQIYRDKNEAEFKNFFNDWYNKKKINIIFLYISEFYLNPDLSYLKKENTIVFLFSWDDRLHFHSWHKGQSVGISQMCQHADINLSMGDKALDRYFLKKSIVFDWNKLIKDFSKPTTQTQNWVFKKLTNRVLFFGSRYGFRAKLVNKLRSQGIPVDAFGPGWENDFVSNKKLSKMVKSYALTLGCSTIGYGRTLEILKGRDFEVPLMGGLYLTSHSNYLRNIYPDDAVMSYKTIKECVFICRTVLQNPSSYYSYRNKAYNIALNYSWKNRVAVLNNLLQSEY